MRHLLVALSVATAWAVSGSAALAQGQDGAFRASLTPEIEFNNHIEFGISVDPSTVSGDTASQLKGSRSGLSARVETDGETGCLAYRLTFAPAVENYTGEDGFLDQFDGVRLPLAVSVAYRSTGRLPELRLRARATRLTRDAGIYDNWDPAVEIRVGEFASYEFRRRVFDESDRREDYLLISSTRHQGRGSLRILGGARTRVDMSYTVEGERYGVNLSELLYIAIGEASTFRRSDVRQVVDASALRVLSSSLLLQAGGSMMWNESNSDFYDFRTAEATGAAFWSGGEGRWVRAEVRRGWLDYGRREFSETLGGPTVKRRDTSWRGVLTTEWRVVDTVALTASADVLRNRTNDSREGREFLNYTQRIYRVGVAARY
jgi:hypothetical protein